MHLKGVTSLACILLACSAAAAQTTYVAVDLTTGASKSHSIHRINLTGQAVGSAGAVDGAGTQAFLADGSGRIQMLGMPGGDYSEATGVNHAGAVVGFANNGSNVRAFLWNGSFQDLGSLPGDQSAKALAINDQSQVVGYSAGPSGVHAFVWSSRSGMQPVFPAAPWSEAHDISASGVIVGALGPSFSTGQAVYRATNGSIINLGTLSGDTQSNALSISNDGQYVVGSSSTATTTRAFRWSKKQGMQPLKDLNGGSSISTVAFAVNSAGTVVGSSVTAIGARAAVWAADGSVKDLNDMLAPNTNILLTQALAINENGVILAVGAPMGSMSLSDLDDEHHAGPVHAYLLKPLP